MKEPADRVIDRRVFRANMINANRFMLEVLASYAIAALLGAAIAAPAPLQLSEAQRLAIERSPRIAAYDSTANVAREAALAWLECHYIEEMTRVADDQRKFASVELEASERLYWAGRVSQAEFYGARSLLAVLEDKWSELVHRSRAARIALKRWVGEAGDAPLGAVPDIDRIRLTSAGLEGDLARDPDVVLLEKQAESATSDVSIVQADRRSGPGIAVKIANRDDARGAREEKLRAKVMEMRTLIEQWQHARDRRTRYVRDIVPLSRERTLASVVAYRGGKATLTEVLAARRAEIDTHMQSIEVERDVARLWAQLDFALPETLTTLAPKISPGDSAR